ncbi:hypothetical protein QTP70_018515, partial [Hemibagrus guttatus]
IANELSRYGRLVSPIKRIPLGYADIKCFKCGRTGHLVRAYPERQSDPGVSERPGQEAAEPAVVVPPAATVQPAAESPGVAAAPEQTESEPQAQPAAQKPTGATITPEEPCAAEPVTVKSCSAELVSVRHGDTDRDQEKPCLTEPDLERPCSVDSGAVLELSVLAEAGTEVQNLEAPVTTPVHEDGGDVEMEDEPTFKVPTKKKKKGKGHGKKQAKTETKTDDRESDSEDCLSDSVFNFASQEEQLSVVYPAENIKEFLRTTKWQKNVVIEEFFPDRKQFIPDVKHFRREGAFIDVEVYRLRKLIAKAAFNSLQEWWGFTKTRSKQINSRKELEIVELQRLEATGNRGHTGSPQNLEQKNGQKRFIHAVRTESGDLLSEPTEIRKQTVCFYSKPYSSERSGAQIVEESFLKDLPKLLEQAARELDGELTLAELHEALQGIENGQAPCIDGLPVEFYKAFWAVIGQDILEVLRDSMNVGQLPLSCRSAVLTLLSKKGDLTHLKNWHPVSLLCTDIKLLSKALASRLTKVMEQITHQDQSYCVPDRACERQTEQVEAVGPKDVLQGANAGHQQPSRVVPLAQAGMCGSTAKPAGKHPGPAGGIFWDGLHWISQSVLHLPKEEGGQGLVQLASRTAAFHLQFLQRLLTGPKDLIWRPVAHGLLHKVGGLGLPVSGLPSFYRGIFKIWNCFRKQNKGCGTLHWLLEEPLIHGGHLEISGVTAPALSRALISSGVVTLRELVNIAGTDLSWGEDLAARLGLRSLRVVNQLLHRWRTVLTSKECFQLMDYQITETNPAKEGSFPQLDIAPEVLG